MSHRSTKVGGTSSERTLQLGWRYIYNKKKNIIKLDFIEGRICYGLREKKAA